MALFWSYLYVGGIVGLGEAANRLGAPRELSRKFIHVGVGLWIFGTLALFDRPDLAVIPPITSAVGNWFIHRYRLLSAVEAEPSNLGTVYFPISFAILILLGWAHPAAVAGGVMAMTIGDAAASLVGQRWSIRRYQTLGGNTKSLGGSLAMFAATLASTLFVLEYYGAGGFALAALVAVVATCAEALGEKGRDNLWVPLSVGAVIYLALQWLPAPVVSGLSSGALLALGIGIIAWWRSSLTPSGVLGAVLTGTLVFGLSGWPGGLAMVGFFVSSSLLSHLFKSEKASAEKDYVKSGQRDLGQALANGGVAAAAAVAFSLTGQAAYLGAVLGSLAAANADTWATELGVLSKSPPRLITTLAIVPHGTSGGITWAGSMAALAGAACVGLVAGLGGSVWFGYLGAIALAGFAGAMIDSLLGATLQAMYYCPTCQRETERRLHGCGAVTQHKRGWRWLGNDQVNLVATLAGAAIGFWLTSFNL